MREDPVVAEVRKSRLRHARAFKFDLDAIVADLRRVQSASGHRVVALNSKRRLVRTGT